LSWASLRSRYYLSSFRPSSPRTGRRYPEGCIQARRSGSRPQPERSRTIVIAAAPRGKITTVMLGGPTLAKDRKLAIASIKALADQQAANMLPVIREIQRTGGLGVIARPVRSTSGALRLRFSRAAVLGRSAWMTPGVVHF
jgi:hypothetical protein